MKIQVIIGSTRPGRAADRVAAWVTTAAASVDGLDTEIVDLRDYELPFFDEALSPRYNPQYAPNAAAQKFLDKLAEGDGYIFLTAEYNHSITGVLKNALDYVTSQLEKKPALLVGYGSVGGARAVEHLRNILSESRMVSVPQAVALVGMVPMIMDENGVLDPSIVANPYGPQAALTTCLNELAWWTKTLKAGREQA